MNNPLVSISCITYNHAPYIRECLDGFMMQKCDFDFEILIHDDASTDGTQEIIKEYQEKYPDIIKPIFQTENQYSKGVRGMMARFNFPRAKGKYVALCEGDDYWTDPLKLQKQVDFLEKNTQYSLCAGGYKSINKKNGEEIVDIKDIKGGALKGFVITIEMLFEHIWYTKTLTLIFRKDLLDFEELKRYKFSRDFHLNYLLLKNRNGYYIKEIFGVYNIHDGGIFSSTDELNKIRDNLKIYKEILKFNPKDDLVRKVYLNSLRASIVFNIGEDKKSNRLKEMFLLMRNLNDFVINIKTFLYILLYKKNIEHK